MLCRESRVLGGALDELPACDLSTSRFSLYSVPWVPKPQSMALTNESQKQHTRQAGTLDPPKETQVFLCAVTPRTYRVIESASEHLRCDDILFLELERRWLRKNVPVGFHG